MENLFSTDDTAQRSNEGHKKIMEAIIAKDSERAKKDIVEHLDVVEGIIKKNIMSST
jgi:DNA-binding FadR family transcriptional regulator